MVISNICHYKWHLRDISLQDTIIISKNILFKEIQMMFSLSQPIIIIINLSNITLNFNIFFKFAT